LSVHVLGQGNARHRRGVAVSQAWQITSVREKTLAEVFSTSVLDNSASKGGSEPTASKAIIVDFNVHKMVGYGFFVL